MEHACIHIYCGDGKGKSTAAMGLALRAAGSGKKVLVTQFLKDGSSSELKILRELPGVKVLTCPRQFGFFWNMTEEQKEQAKCSYEELFEDRERVLAFLKEKPEGLETVLTGRDPAPELVELADYVSEIQKKKHPFDKGVPARRGIEL